jgi:hypothetical protein
VGDFEIIVTSKQQDLRSLASEKIQAALGLNRTQVAKLAAIYREHRAAIGAGRSELLSDHEHAAELEEVHSAVMNVLNRHQRAALREASADEI